MKRISISKFDYYIIDVSEIKINSYILYSTILHNTPQTTNNRVNPRHNDVVERCLQYTVVVCVVGRGGEWVFWSVGRCGQALIFFIVCSVINNRFKLILEVINKMGAACEQCFQSLNKPKEPENPKGKKHT